AVELARGHERLLVAAGEVAGGRERRRRADVESGDELARFFAAAGAIDERSAGVGRVALVAEGEVFFDAQGEAERAAVAVLGQMHDARGARGGGGARPARSAGEAEGAREGAEAGED